MVCGSERNKQAAERLIVTLDRGLLFFSAFVSQVSVLCNRLFL